ncbi:MAG: SH3 domain-containing protein [Spirochaetes bacterium]|nr:SH3 domain-containing protein [Spirochaetota bacterium]
MIKKGVLFLVIACALLYAAGCKKEGVVLVNTSLRDNPKVTRGEFKWVKVVNRGQQVTILEEKNDEWYQVQLSDGVTKGWLEKKYVHRGEKKIISFSGETKLLDQPDENSRVLRTLPAGTKAIVLKEKSGWAEVNVRWGLSGWIPQSGYSLDSDATTKAIYEVYISGVGKCEVEASSTLTPQTGAYTANRMFDGNPGTAWQEGEDDDGEGQWVEIRLPEPSSVSISLVNGMAAKDEKYASYGADGDLYLLNNRVKSLRVEYDETDSAGGEGMSTQSKTVTLEDDFRDFQDLGTFHKLIRIRLAIDGVYRGEKWRDTSIGEIRIVKAQY